MSTIITGHTGFACLLGSPVEHSISPAMHNAAFEKLEIDKVYLAFDITKDKLPATVETLFNLNVTGFNLTMPLKNTIVPLCDSLSPAARISGSVNTVINKNGKIVGDTTDGIGFMNACQDAGHDPLSGKMVLLGAGGAAASILVQAALDGVPEISIFNRPGNSYDSISAIMKQLENETKCKMKLFTYEDQSILKSELSEANLLVNASSVGMAPNDDASLIDDISLLHSGLFVYDIIYNPATTKLMKQAMNAGCRTANGHLMLLYQGAASFKLWTGQDMPVDYIKELCFN